MILTFVRERLSWILLFVGVHLLLLFIAAIDLALPFASVLYFASLSFILFIFFLVIRYQKETKFFINLKEREDDLDRASSKFADSPFENIIATSITNQTNRLHGLISQNMLTLEQEKDDLLSWIHEVKTPLTAMHLMIDRLNDDEPMKARLAYEWLRIYLLLDQQLHQKRILFIENDLHIEETDLEALLFHEIKTLQSWCIHKKIGFDMELEIAYVLSDAKWLAFILRQLLTNAIKYSEASDISIRSYEQNDRTILEVKDSGRGIDPRDMPRIFDKGFTSTAKHQDHAATGLGLYLTKKAAKPLLLQIDVHSVWGEGTIVSLTFPQKNQFVYLSSM